MRFRSARPGAVLAASFALALSTAPGSAQTLEGRVIDGRNLSSVPGTLIRLLDGGDNLRAVTIADDEGLFRIQAPAPGTYRVVAARLGVEDYRSQQVDMPEREGVYQLNITVVPSAIPLEGLEVNAERQREMSRALRLLLGTNPSTLRTPPIRYRELLAHAERGRRITDVVRVSNVPGMTVRIEEQGPPCFMFRSQDCAPVFLDGSRVPADLLNQVPLELLETIVFVSPGESTDYGGSILLYTFGWLGDPRN